MIVCELFLTLWLHTVTLGPFYEEDICDLHKTRITEDMYEVNGHHYVYVILVKGVALE